MIDLLTAAVNAIGTDAYADALASFAQDKGYDLEMAATVVAARAHKTNRTGNVFVAHTVVGNIYQG